MPSSALPPKDDALVERWERFTYEVALASSGGSPFPVELLTLPVEIVAAGHLAPVRGLGAEIAALLLRRAELLAPSTIGPNHHAVAAAVVALEQAGVDVGTFLRYVRATWAAPPPRPQRSYDMSKLIPYAPPPRKK